MKKKGFFKKTQALVLALAIIMSVLVPFSSLNVLAEAKKKETAYEGKIVADNYELSEAEKALISSGLLIGGTHEYLVPDSDDGLITVDTDNKQITVADYEGTDGYIWKAVEINIVVGNEVKETVSLTDGKGNYTFGGNAFSVIAEYALDVEITEEKQTVLLYAPQYLTEGLENLKDVAAVKNDLAIIQQAMPEMVMLATTGMLIKLPIIQDQSQYVTLSFKNEDANNATLEFDRQMTQNGGELDLTVMLNQYENAASKVEYLINNGEALRLKAQETQQNIEKILSASFWSLVEVLDSNEYAALHILKSSLTGSSQKLKTVCEKSWDVLNKQIVKDNLTALEYSALDNLVAQITSLTDLSGVEIKNPLRVSTTTIQYNMSMFDVTVKVVLKLTDPSSTEVKYYEYGSKTTTVTLAEGASKAEIIEAVSATGIEKAAINSWGSSYVNGKFTAQKTLLPEELMQDTEYVITYTPNLYNVTFEYDNLGTIEYPYGYIVKLENHSDKTKAYDYTINGTYYAQGSSYKITEATSIERKVGKSYDSSNLYQIVADNYLSDKGAAILTSGALLGDTIVSVRKPDNSNNIVSLSGNKLTAANYSASYNNLYWKPFSYTLSNKNTYLFNGANEITIGEEFDSVTVTYHLYLENFDNNTVIDVTNISHLLNEESKAQIAALNRISAQKGNLEILNRSMVSILAGLIENTVLSDDAAKNEALKTCFKNVLNDIQAESMGSKDLYLFEIVSEYTSATDGLLYYYNNSDRVINEINKMSEFMTRMLGEGEGLSSQEKIDALERLIRSLPPNVVSPDKIDEYISKLTTLESIMTGVKADLTAPNAIINLNSSNLGTLTKALQATGNTENFTTLSEGLHLKDSSIVVVASNKMAVKVTLQIEGGKNVTATSDTVFVDEIIDATFVENLKNLVKEQLSAQSINGKYYDTSYVENAFDSLVGMVAGEVTETEYEFIWTYKSFAVSVPGTQTQYVTFKNRGINLPASTDQAYRYDYYVNGTKVNGNAYTLSDDEFDKVVDGTFNVTKKEVYILRENLTNYVNNLNSTIGDDQVIFALVEDQNGNFSIVLKADASAPNGLMAAVQQMAVGMVQGSYPYVGINNDSFLDNGTVYLQTIIDALFESGAGTDTMLTSVDREGNINNMNLQGNIITDKVLSQYGGKLLETSMQLGTSAGDAVSVPFYVTLGAVNDDFVQIRNLFEDNLSSFATFNCEQGALNITLNMPQKMYEAFLAVLLVTENISLNDINAVNGEITISFLNNMLIPLFRGDITVETFDNTLSMFGADMDLSSQKGAELLFAKLKSFYLDCEFSYDEISGTATGTVGISSLIDSMNIGVLGNIIAEKETGIDINVRIALTDLGNEYEALYLDTDAAGMTNKIGLTSDLGKKIQEISGASVIVLLKDIEEDLAFNTTTLLNLNGFNVSGDILANKKTIIIDSNIDSSKTATVTGQVSGNATIVAGKYTQDVTEFVKNGFTQNEEGVVTNNFYNIYKDTQGNVVVELKAGLIHTKEIPDISSLVIDIACELLFNGYSSNYLEIDGKTIYNISIKDLVGIYSSSNRVDTVINEAMGFIDSTQLSEFINTLLDDALDFTAISNAIAQDKPVFEYSMATKPWAIELIHVKEGDYISSNISSGEKNIGNIKIMVVGDQADKDYFVDLFKELGETVTSDFNVNISHEKIDKTLKITAIADGNVMVDLTNPDYAIMFSIIAADGITGIQRDQLVSAIRTYYETGDMNALRLAFNSLNTAQLITAIKNVGVSDKFIDMVKSLGLDDVVSDDVVELEALYDKIGKVAAYVVRKAGIVGGNRTLGSFLDSDGTYGVSRENINKIGDIALLRGYGLDADITIANASVKIKLFDLEAPSFVDGHGAAEVLPSDKLAGAVVEHDKMCIYLDTQISGMTVAQVKELLKFYAYNADEIEIVIGDGTLGDDDLVANGTKVTAIAKREGAQSAVVTYTIVVVGDINCNGRIEVGDAVLISRMLVGEIEFSDIQNSAADNNCNGRVDIGDATRIASKIVDWNKYETMLGKTNA